MVRHGKDFGPWHRSQDQNCSRTKFQERKFFWFLEIFSEFLGLQSGSSNVIFSQPMFRTNIWTALFEKETLKEKPSMSKCSKMFKIWRENLLIWLVSISRDYWGYLHISWWNSEPWTQNSGKSLKNRDFFPEQIWSCNQLSGAGLSPSGFLDLFWKANWSVPSYPSSRNMWGGEIWEMTKSDVVGDFGKIGGTSWKTNKKKYTYIGVLKKESV